MATTIDALLDEVAAIDPEKAAYLRWVRPQLKDDGLITAARQFLASHPALAARRAAGPKETLLDLDLGLDPDEPTGLFEAMGGHDEGMLQDEPTSQGDRDRS